MSPERSEYEAEVKARYVLDVIAERRSIRSFNLVHALLLAKIEAPPHHVPNSYLKSNNEYLEDIIEGLGYQKRFSISDLLLTKFLET